MNQHTSDYIAMRALTQDNIPNYSFNDREVYKRGSISKADLDLLEKSMEDHRNREILTENDFPNYDNK